MPENDPTVSLMGLNHQKLSICSANMFAPEGPLFYNLSVIKCRNVSGVPSLVLKGPAVKIPTSFNTTFDAPQMHPSELLAHAVRYLITEQLEGRRCCIPANREAVAILCDAGRELWLGDGCA